jgi:hypothetical protein
VQVDFGHYAEGAAELVNADLSSVEALQAQLEDREWLRERVASADLRPLRRFAQDLGEVIDASAAGDDMSVVNRLNALLEQHPVRPRISGHDSSTWHLHVNDSSDPVAAILIGADRFGRCADETCRGAFFDGTANHSKRFCCSRCATRTNVAAYRQRRAPSE